MESMDTFITTQMATMEAEMKRHYKEMMTHHREEQMALSPDDYTPNHGIVPFKKYDGTLLTEREYPPIPEGRWPIVFRHIYDKRSRGYEANYFICVDNYGNTYSMNNPGNTYTTTIPANTYGWAISPIQKLRKVMLTNKLIDLFQKDSWSPVINATIQPSINQLFLDSLCEIAEDYNRRFIKYDSLYQGGHLLEYDACVCQMKDLADELMTHETTIAQLTESVNKYKETIATLKKEHSDLNTEIRTLKDKITTLEIVMNTNEVANEESISIMESDNIKRATHDRNVISKLKKNSVEQTRTIEYYRKQNAKLEEELTDMVPKEEFRSVQKDCNRFKKLYEAIVKSLDDRFDDADAGAGSSTR